MFNLIPSLPVSLKLCAVVALLIACSGCAAVVTVTSAALTGYAAHTAPQDAADAKKAAKAAAAPYKDNYEAIPNPEHFAAFGNHSTAE